MLNKMTLMLMFVTLAFLVADAQQAEARESDTPKKLFIVKGVDSESDVVVRYTDPATDGQHQKIKYEKNGDGEVHFAIPAGVKSVKVSKYSDGEYLTYSVLL